jgi:demethoxyubiquinone hydroxylase (CLK1/Coq7/Cat5 family)
MKKQLLKLSIRPVFLIAALAFAVCIAASAQPSDAMIGQPVPPLMPKWCEDMVKMQEDFLKMLKTQDAELASQVEKMKSASEDQKESAVEATLVLLIQQQLAQHSKMEKMVEKMKDYMAKNSCPMMRDMK